MDNTKKLVIEENTLILAKVSQQYQAEIDSLN